MPIPHPLKCLILDDEKIARDIIRNYVSKLPNLELIGECKNPLEAIVFLQNQQVDLLFLDIQMPELTGIEFYKSLRQKPMAILTTAYSEYALEGFQLDVVDYLMKPIRFDRFVEAVNKAIRRKGGSNFSQNLPKLTENIIPKQEYLLVKADHKIHKIKFSDIIFIEGMREYVAYHLPQGRILAIQRMKQLENMLPKNDFLRIHKSFIVSISKVTALEGNMLHIHEKKLPIGGLYKQMVLERIF